MLNAAMACFLVDRSPANGACLPSVTARNIGKQGVCMKAFSRGGRQEKELPRRGKKNNNCIRSMYLVC